MTLPRPADPLTDSTTGAGVRQTPAVPISVYREIATELKASQALVDSLNQQNQRLDRENQLLRQEILKFTDAAAHLRVVASATQGVALAPGNGAESSQNAYPVFIRWFIPAVLRLFRDGLASSLNCSNLKPKAPPSQPSRLSVSPPHHRGPNPSPPHRCSIPNSPSHLPMPTRVALEPLS
jgi:hypothetical protein